MAGGDRGEGRASGEGGEVLLPPLSDRARPNDSDCGEAGMTSRASTAVARKSTEMRSIATFIVQTLCPFVVCVGVITSYPVPRVRTRPINGVCARAGRRRIRRRIRRLCWSTCFAWGGACRQCVDVRTEQDPRVGNLSADLGECAERGPCDTPGDAPEGRLRTCNGCRCKTKPVTVAES